eukprot:jgi/Mesen1/10863/ME000093S10379
MAEVTLSNYVGPVLVITAVTALTFVAVSFNELREKSLTRNLELEEMEEKLSLRSSMSAREKREARQQARSQRKKP